jgi:UDP-3-O-[3-hydroxymyristoyl] N-acetylglucosamine deacetylase/3-hydroxyacyl-[acyl-carrier-protein] dehydratase
VIASRRRTLAAPQEICGAGLHEGLPTKVRLLPAEAGAGIRFVRTDLAGEPAVQAVVAYRTERPRRTALVQGRAEVHTVEHLLAAVGALGITDLTVEIDRVEVPGLDGSSLEFVRALEAAGLRELGGAVPKLCLAETIVIEEGGALLVASPLPGALEIEYHLDYAEDIPQSAIRLRVTRDSFLRQAAPARTFCLEREARALQAAGLGRGATTQNTLVIGEDGRPLENTYRFPHECARHKLLDAFGDLMLLGASLEARIVAYKSGHAQNAELARRLRQRLLQGAGPCAAPAPEVPSLLADVQREGAQRLTAQVAMDHAALALGFPAQPAQSKVAALAALGEALALLGRGDAAPTLEACFGRGVSPEGLRLSASFVDGLSSGRVTNASGDVFAEIASA